MLELKGECSFSNTVRLCYSLSQHRFPTSNVCSSNTGRRSQEI